MAASMMRTISLVTSVRNAITLKANNVNKTWARSLFFRRKKDAQEDAELTSVEDQLSAPAKILRKREGLQTIRGYSPPADVESRVHSIASNLIGEVADWKNYRFDNNRVKFQFLTQVMSEFDHFIPNTDLTNIHSVADVVAFFSTAVRDTTSYEDLTKLNLPPNLHIELEHVRFNPETDTLFGGVSAFPQRPTIITSLKYRRKYGKKNE